MSNRRKKSQPTKNNNNNIDYLNVTIRDSGIVEDNDDSSSTSSSVANRASFNFIPSRQVQNRIKCFEFLAQERGEFHTNPNWWLEEQKRIEAEAEGEEEGVEVEEQNKVILQQQTSVSSQKSRSSVKTQISRHSEPPEEVAVGEIPEIIFDDADESEKGEEEGEEDVEVFIRHSVDRMRISRPPSINSQTSTWVFKNLTSIFFNLTFLSNLKIQI